MFYRGYNFRKESIQFSSQRFFFIGSDYVLDTQILLQSRKHYNCVGVMIEWNLKVPVSNPAIRPVFT